jgi:transglutaminase-like putative cysteine protease
MSETEAGSDSATDDSLPYGIVLERPEMDRYLEDTIVIDWQTPTVFEQAKTLSAGLAHGEETARALFGFVRDEIDHSFDIETDAVPCNASQVLKQGSGLCYAKCHLLAALLRARGIPTGFGYQRLQSDRRPGRFVLHGFVGVYLSDRERWVLLDPRGNNETLRTDFALDEPSLAYTPDPELDETTLPRLLARPAKRVVDMLDQSETLSRIRDHLPDRID